MICIAFLFVYIKIILTIFAKNKLGEIMFIKRKNSLNTLLLLPILFLVFFSIFIYLTKEEWFLKQKPLYAQTGSYIFTAISVTGTVESAVGGRVQINGGTISGVESATFPYYTSTTIQAYANEGYEFTGWYTAVLGGQLKTRNTIFTFHMPSENTTYYAIFTITRHNINVSSSPIGAGNITGGGTHNYNTNITLTATPINTNYSFYRWIEGSNVVSLDYSYAFTVKENRSLVAEFKVKVTVMVTGGGSVTLNEYSGFTSGYFSQTENIVLEASSDIGYKFIGWSNASVSTSPIIQVLVGTVAKTYVANFELIGAYLFVNATEGGSIAGTSASGTYPVGEVIVLSATANSGYHFISWQGEVSGVLQRLNQNTSYIVMLSDVLRGEITLTAVFERDYVNLHLNAVVSGIVSDIGGTVGINDGEFNKQVTELMPPEQIVIVKANKKSGYKFLGWFTELSGGERISAELNYSFVMPIIEKTYYAVFQLSYWYEYRIMPLGDGTEKEPYLIKTENELAWLSYATNTGLNFSSGVYAKLDNHLNLSEFMWEPIGNGVTLSASSKWQGIFNGGGYVISGVFIEKEQGQVSYNGLFGSIYGTGAKVLNLGVENSVFKVNSSHNMYLGGIAGYLEGGTVEVCYVENTLLKVNSTNGNHYVGLIVGANTNGNIKNCYAIGNIETQFLQQNNSYIGGLVGNNYGNSAMAKDCYFVGNIQNLSSQTSTYIGALVGYNSLGANLLNSYYSLELTNLPTVGVNNSMETGSGGRQSSELSIFSNYVNENSMWNFEFFWFMPNSVVNMGCPVLKGIGNIIVTTEIQGNGTITPSGQAIYFKDNILPTYIISPSRNYRIASVTINDELLPYYSEKETSQAYHIEKSVGNLKINAVFEEIPKEPLNPIFIILFITIPLTLLILILTKLIKKRSFRRVRIKSSIRNFKKNREHFFKFNNRK